MDDYDMGPMLTISEVAKLLHVHSNTARRWANQGVIKTYCIGTRKDRRFKREDIDHYLKGVAKNTGIAMG
jgi:excisionase family DNA binding protein